MSNRILFFTGFPGFTGRRLLEKLILYKYFREHRKGRRFVL